MTVFHFFGRLLSYSYILRTSNSLQFISYLAFLITEHILSFQALTGPINGCFAGIFQGALGPIRHLLYLLELSKPPS